MALAVIIGASILLLGAHIGVNAFAKCGRHGAFIPIPGTPNYGADQMILIDTSISPQKEIKKTVFDPFQGLQDMFQDITCGCKTKC